MFHANRPLTAEDGANRRRGLQTAAALAALLAAGPLPLVLEGCRTRPIDGLSFLNNEANIGESGQATIMLLPGNPQELSDAQTSTYDDVGMTSGVDVDADHVFGGVRVFMGNTGPGMPSHYVAEITDFGATGQGTFEDPVALNALSTALQGRAPGTPVKAFGYCEEFWYPAPNDPQNSSVPALPTNPDDTLNNAMVFLVTQASA